MQEVPCGSSALRLSCRALGWPHPGRRAAGAQNDNALQFADAALLHTKENKNNNSSSNNHNYIYININNNNSSNNNDNNNKNSNENTAAATATTTTTTSVAILAQGVAGAAWRGARRPSGREQPRGAGPRRGGVLRLDSGDGPADRAAAAGGAPRLLRGGPGGCDRCWGRKPTTISQLQV